MKSRHIFHGILFETVIVLAMLLPFIGERATAAQATEKAGTFSTVLRRKETLKYIVSLSSRLRAQQEQVASDPLSSRSW
jgi:hypothetical protein